ncbi:MAG: two-component system sensor histidine kinase ChiS, partial [Glaciecola sp.]
MKARIVLTFLLLFSFGLSHAQSYHFVNLTVEDGLSQNDVVSILQDKRGLLWMATKGGGLTIFDGVDYSYLKQEDGLSSNIVYCLFQDTKRNVWIGTYEGLVKYDGQNLETYTTEDGLNSDIIKTICEDTQGRLWVGTENGGVSILAAEEDSTGVVFSSYESSGPYIGNNFNRI